MGWGSLSGARGGHIPGARSLPWGRLDAVVSFGQRPSCRASWGARGLGGLSPDREIIVYCTGGVRSAFVVAVLAQLGYRRVRNYDSGSQLLGVGGRFGTGLPGRGR